MTRLRSLLIVGLLCYLAACRQKAQLSIVFDRVDELQVGNSVFYHGLEIGKVSNLSEYHDSILVTVQLRDNVKIPAGSIFRYVHELLMSPAIQVDYSNQQHFLSVADTCIGQYQKKQLLDHLLSDSSRHKQIQQSLNKIGEGLSELVKAIKDSGRAKE